MEYLELGDNVYIGRDVYIMTPRLVIGDYGTVHKNCRISGYAPCLIGHNFWCDQNTILNCTDSLTIGNNVGIGAYSQLWTHIKFGDVLEGCRFHSTRPLVIEDDVWFVGHCVVSPIVAKKKSMAMVGSVITKDMEENHIYGGCPAVDLTGKLGNQFVVRSLSEKRKMMKAKLVEFTKKFSQDTCGKIEIVESYPAVIDKSITYFNIADRTYTKRQSELEIKFMKFLLPLFKFIPTSNLNT